MSHADTDAHARRAAARVRLLTPVADEDAPPLVTHAELSRALAEANRVSLDLWARQQPTRGPYR